MRKQLAFLALCSLLLAGCAVRDAKSSGEASSEIENAQLSLNLELPKEIHISRMSNYRNGATISDRDKQRALTDSKSLVGVMFKGFTERFPVLAATRGLRIVAPPKGESILRFTVTALHLGCTDMGCRPNLELRVVLLRNDTYAPLWTYTSNVGPATVYSDISDELFESFSKDLLQAMGRDHVLRR